MNTHDIPLTSVEYQSLKNEITKRIRSAQYEALKAVNKEMIALYWEMAGASQNSRQHSDGESLLWKTFPKIFKRSFRAYKDSVRGICGIWHDSILNINQIKFCNHWSQKSVGQNISSF